MRVLFVLLTYPELIPFEPFYLVDGICLAERERPNIGTTEEGPSEFRL